MVLWRLGQADREGQEGTGKDKLRRNKAMKKAVICWIVGIFMRIEISE
jgi:hypothetical protein